jgi:hypothetical protein
MDAKKVADDFLASLAVLNANIGLFRRGAKDMYRVVATELRKLLCDGKTTLLPRVFENIGSTSCIGLGFLSRAHPLQMD